MKLKENISLYYSDESKKVVINSGTKSFLITDNNRTFYNILLNLHNLSKDSELSEFLIQNDLVFPEYKQTRDDILLNERTLLYILDRASSKLVLSDLNIIEILNAPILIIGCGGIGTIVFNNLLQAGFNNFTIVDKDKVEQTNLNRQLFYTKEDVGRGKIDVLEENVLKNWSGVTIKKWEQFITKEEQVLNILDQANYQIVINCADTPSNIEYIIAEACSEKDIPVISGHVGLETGTINPIYDRYNQFNKSDSKEISAHLKASISTTNMVTASLLSQIVFDYLFKDIVKSSYNFYDYHVINFKTMEITEDG